VDLVLEVTRRNCEPKSDYLKRVLEKGSTNAKILKVADRISNLTDLNLDVYTESKVSNYLDETEMFVVPMAREVNADMYKELTDLISIRRKLLHSLGN
jgi:GTP pyrophosphokinase